MVRGGVDTFGAGVDLSRRVRSWRDEVTRTSNLGGAGHSVEGVRDARIRWCISRGKKGVIVGIFPTLNIF